MPVPCRVKERLSYLWGSKVTSPGLGVLRILNTRRYHLVSVDRTSLVPSGLFGWHIKRVGFRSRGTFKYFYSSWLAQLSTREWTFWTSGAYSDWPLNRGGLFTWTETPRCRLRPGDAHFTALTTRKAEQLLCWCLSAEKEFSFFPAL